MSKLISGIEMLLILYLLFSVLYALFLAMIYFLRRERPHETRSGSTRFAIVIPAHDEELIVDGLCNNLKVINYGRNLYDIYFVADNCSDGTAAICRANGFTVLERHDETRRGKGYALEFALENIPLDRYDALLVVDADTHLDPDILTELGALLRSGERAIQCHIKIPNRNESWFTQLLNVSRIINALFYHYPKSELGLSSYLMGSGICFSMSLLKKRGWTAFSIAEDWEYYAQLLLGGDRIVFAKNAVVYQYESKTLGQATSQRLRWSSGRWKISRSLGLRLMAEGLKRRSLLVFDASLPLILPNFSLQINLSFLALVIAFLLPPSALKLPELIVCFGLLGAQFLIFFMGACVAGSPWRILWAALHAPLFLLWKAVIDLLCFTGLYRGTKWVRTRRHQADAG